MPAVMLEYEEPQQESRGGDDQEHANPIAILKRDRAGCPEQYERNQRYEELTKAAP